MEKNTTPWQGRRYKLFLFALFGLMVFTGNTYAQSIEITWDSEVGCLVYDEQREKYEEDIQDGPCVRVCEFSSVTYNLTGDIANWQSTAWTATGGTISSSSLTSCTVNWGAAGAGTLMAAITKNDNTIEEVEICIEIIDSPEARFGLLPDLGSDFAQVCLEDILQFVNLSDPDGGSDLISYYWDFGDGNFSSEFEPTHSYDSPGGYTVVLTVTNACNCTSKYKMEIEVGEGGFQITCPSVVCEGGQGSYMVPEEIADKCGFREENWSVEGGTILSYDPNGGSVQVIWDNVDETGFGYVTYDASDCGMDCGSIVTVAVPVIQAQGTIVGDLVMCTNSQSLYKLPQWPSTNFDWTLDAGSTGATLTTTENKNEIVIQSTSNTGQVTLNATYYNTLLNCGGVATITVSIRDRAVFTGDIDLCNNTTGNYALQSGSGNWTLTGPGGTFTGSGSSFSHLYTVAGNYTLTVTGSTFCQPEELDILVRAAEAAPSGITGPTVVCRDTPTTYSVTNTVPGTQIGWEVIGGSIAGSNYGDQVDITFTGAGPYTINVWRETINAPSCRSDQTTITVTEPVVTSNITGDTTVCSSNYEMYDAGYADGDDYIWTITPATAGSVSSGNGTDSVTILWNETPGIATVNLAIERCGTLHPQPGYTVNVITSPNVTLNSPPATICSGDTVNFQLLSTPTLTSGTVTWDFGDGTIVTTDDSMAGWTSQTHTFTSSSTSQINYNVVITVNDANGCINPAIVSHSIDVNPSPVASISPAGNYSICPSMSPQTLTVNIQGGIGALSTIAWYRNGVLQVSGAPALNQTYTATSYGSYYAIVTANNGCTTTTNTTQYNGNCGGPPPCTTGQTVTITSSVNNCGTITVNGTFTGTPTSVQWITPATPASQSTTNNVGTFTYDESGSYTIFYRVIYGTCAVTRSVTVVVPYLPELKHTVTCGTGGNYSVELLDNSNFYPGNPINNYTFRINGTVVQSGAAISHLASLPPGMHTIQLTIDGPTSTPCSTSIETIDLPALPLATFTHDAPRCEEAVINFAPDDIQPGLTYLWQFGDSSSNAQQSPDKVYDTFGNRTVTLTVTNQFGCSTTSSSVINVTPNQLAGLITATALTACDGETETLSYTPNLGSPTPTVFEWSRNGVVVATTPTLNVTTSGNYSLNVETNLGCTLGLNAVIVNFIKAPVASINGPDETCAGDTFVLTTPAGGTGADYAWTLNGSPLTAFNGENSIEQTINVAGTYNYAVTTSISDGSGGFCTNTDAHTVVVNALPASPSISFSMLDCDTYTVELVATGPGPGTYTWSNGMTGDTIEVTQGGPYQVRYTNASGCTSTRDIFIPRDPAVHFWTVPVGCYQFCEALLGQSSITAGPTVPYDYWAWLNGEVQLSGMFSLVGDLDLGTYGGGTYQLTLDNGLCDRVSGDVNIDVVDCKDCEVKLRVRRISRDEKYGPCAFAITYDIYNPHGVTIPFTITAPNGEGLFLPAGITAPPGSSTHTTYFVPLNGFTGGGVTIYIQGSYKGKPCVSKLEIDLPGCKKSSKSSASTLSDDVFAKSKLSISPNPATDAVQLQYNFSNSADNDVRTLEIYNLMGVLMERTSLEKTNGTWDAQLSRFSAGQYIVVMKLNGTVITQKALIVK